MQIHFTKKRYLIVFIVSLVYLIFHSMSISVDRTFAATEQNLTTSSFQDLPDDRLVKDAVLRLASVGIFNQSDHKFYPNGSVTREQFAKMIVIASNQNERAQLYANASSLFPDVSKKRWSNAYVQWAVKNNLMNGLSDRKFHPTKPVTYHQMVTVFVKMLGYQDADLKGTWPDNYLTKAKEIQLISTQMKRSNAPITRQDVAVILDRLLQMPGKTYTKPFGEQVAHFQETIVLSKSIQNGIEEVKTTIGTFENPLQIAVEEGDLLWAKIENGELIKVYSTQFIKETKQIDRVAFPDIYFRADDPSKLKSSFSQTAIYYVNGSKSSYEQLKTLIRSGQQMISGRSSTRSNQEYVLINDLKFENGSYAEHIILDDRSTSAKFDANQIQTDQGILYDKTNEQKLTPGFKYGLFVVDEQVIRVQGVRNAVQDWELIQVNGAMVVLRAADGKSQTLALSPKMSYFYNGTKQNYDGLKTVLKVGQKIQLSIPSDSSDSGYMIIRDPFQSGLGVYSEMLVLANSTTNDKIQSGQLQTEQGIYQTTNLKEEIILGNKYGFLVGNNNQILDAKLIQTAEKGTINRYYDSQITWTKGQVSDVFTLPQSTQYYYNGSKITYDQLKTVIQPSSTLFLIRNTENMIIESALIVDPIYRVPQVATAQSFLTGQIGTINALNQTIIREGNISSIAAVQANDVAYEVTDLANGNKYILILSSRVNGNFKGYYPSLLSPVSIQMEVYNSDTRKYEIKTYEISKHFNVNKLSGQAIPNGAYVTVLFGLNNKVIDILSY